MYVAQRPLQVFVCSRLSGCFILIACSWRSTLLGSMWDVGGTLLPVVV
jgi:hypothetical protein